ALVDSWQEQGINACNENLSQ
ncbi:low molecular weight phosphotyrosine protein phosphatase, partial [Vibrio cholerae]|nr:low molecular weight phosphotyrosine protein phosphatase [Vibrio cholerae]